MEGVARSNPLASVAQPKPNCYRSGHRAQAGSKCMNFSWCHSQASVHQSVCGTSTPADLFDPTRGDLGCKKGLLSYLLHSHHLRRKSCLPALPEHTRMPRRACGNFSLTHSFLQETWWELPPWAGLVTGNGALAPFPPLTISLLILLCKARFLGFFTLNLLPAVLGCAREV